MAALTWSGCRNVRDLGGLPASGGVVREGALVRADSLTQLDEDGREDEREPDLASGLADLYCGSLDRNVVQVAAAVRAFQTAPPGPVVVHCTAGKDRTGMLVALLLETADVPRAAVVEDYAVSADRLGIAAVLASLTPEEREAAARYAWSHPETITAALEHLDRTHGGARAYLRELCGLSEDALVAVSARLTG